MPAILFVLFILGPILELVVIIQVGQILGLWPTVALLVGLSLLGAVLVKREGLKAWWRFNHTVQAGRVPAVEVVDGALVLLGGALLVTPGFLTDALGFVLIVPVTRSMVRRFLRKRTRLLMVGAAGPGARRGTEGRRPSGSDSDVVDVEVVRVERDEPPAPGHLDPGDSSGGDRGDTGPRGEAG